MPKPGTRPRILDATIEAMEAVTDIYAHHVLTGSASFETTPPDLAEITRRMEKIVRLGLPYLVAEVDGAIAGYAYAAPYRTRHAYRFTVEDTVYVAPATIGRGIGSLLLDALIGRCRALGYRQMVAMIGGADNAPSINLHKKMGFKPAGTLKSAGFKFGQWVDQVLMQRPLGLGDGETPE